MPRLTFALAALGIAALSVASVAAGQQPAAGAAAPTVFVVDTVKGVFEIETFPNDAPKSVAKITDLVRTNFYRGQRIHAASVGSIEFGDPSSRNMSKMNEWGFTGSGKRVGVKEVSKRPFERGVVGFAYAKDRTAEDADSHLFVLKQSSPSSVGKFAPIGRVVRGMDVVDKLGTADVIRNITIKAPAAPGAK